MHLYNPSKKYQRYFVIMQEHEFSLSFIFPLKDKIYDSVLQVKGNPYCRIFYTVKRI